MPNSRKTIRDRYADRLREYHAAVYRVSQGSGESEEPYAGERTLWGKPIPEE